MGDRGISGFVAGGGCHVGGCRWSLITKVGREVLGRVSLRLSFGMFLVVSDWGCCWKVLRRMLLGLLLGVSMVVLDRRMRCEVLRRVLLECRWWWSEGVLWKVRVLLVMFDCVRGSVDGGG